MSLIYNGTEVKKLIYNDAECKKAIYNGTEVFSSIITEDIIHSVNATGSPTSSGSQMYYYLYPKTSTTLSNCKIISISPTSLSVPYLHSRSSGTYTYTTMNISFSNSGTDGIITSEQCGTYNEYPDHHTTYKATISVTYMPL